MLSLNQLVSLFLARCQAERLAPGTVTYYSNYLRYLQAAHGGREAGAITIHDLRAVLAGVQAEGRLSATTINHIICAWRACLTWAYREELVPANPAARLHKVRAPQRVPETISRETLQAILRALPPSFAGVRDRTMLLVLLDTGRQVSVCDGDDDLLGCVAGIEIILLNAWGRRVEDVQCAEEGGFPTAIGANECGQGVKLERGVVNRAESSHTD